jgi:hypothetical protein
MGYGVELTEQVVEVVLLSVNAKVCQAGVLAKTCVLFFDHFKPFLVLVFYQIPSFIQIYKTLFLQHQVRNELNERFL